MLRSTFYGFNIAFSGMMTAQRALDLTGNNMSNIDTTGYTRQRLDLNSIPSSSYVDRYAPTNKVAIGGGVNVTRVSQLRDPFLDRRFRNEASGIGEVSANLSVMSDISSIFDEVQFQQGLYQAMQDFRTQLQQYSSQPGEVTIDSTVASAADTMLKMFQQYAVQIANVRDYQESLLNGNGGSIPEVNKMLEQIGLLNKGIRECEIYGNPALEMKDQRNLLLDQLSAYMKIDVSYEKDPDFPGVDLCRVAFLCDNDPPLNLDQRTLVFGKDYAELRVEQVPPTAAGGTPDPDRLTYITSSGLLDRRDPLNTKPLDPKYTPGGNPGLQFTTGAFKGVLDMLNSRGAFDDPPNTVNGIGYYERITNQIVSDFAFQFNLANSIYDSADPDFDPADPNTYTEYKPLFESSDGGPITARNIQISAAWKSEGPYLTTTKLTPVTPDDDVSGDTSNLEYMISLLDKPFNFTTKGIDAGGHPLFTGGFEQMFKIIGLNAANDAGAKQKSLDASQNVIKGIEDLRNSLSSVSMDEEGVNLLRFQKSYAAAARVMTTLDEALDVLINRTGIVGR